MTRKGLWKRLGAWLLTLLMLFGLLPDGGVLLTQAEAAEPETETKVPFSVNTVGTYIPVGIGSGAYTSYIMNGAVSKDLKTYRYGLVYKQIKVDATKNESSDRLQDVTFTDAAGKNEGKMPENVSDYNMWLQFGTVKDGKRSRNPAAGFSTSNADYVNAGTLADDSRSTAPSAGIGKNANSGSWSATIKIAENPILKELAESGELEFTFSALACGAKKYRESLGIDDLAADYHTKVTCTVKQNDKQLDSKSTTDGPWTKGLYVDWTKIGANDTLTFTVSASKKKGNAGKIVGIGNPVLLFRKAGVPKMESDGFTLTANGDYRVSDTGRDQVLLDKTASMDLTLSFANAVKPCLPDFTKTTEETYQFMTEFCSHALFTNLNNTGYPRQGEKANLVLNKVGEKSVSGTSEQISALTSAVKSLNFHWGGETCKGDYYGNNPVPNTGDWISKTSGDLANNNYGFWNKFVLASWHDGAGNPLADSSGNILTITDTGKLSNVPGKGSLTVQRTGGGEQKKVTGMENPFTYDFIIDTMPPTYSITSNGIQPDILTGLTLNQGDEYDLTVHFSEGVQVQRFTPTGAPTGYQDSSVCLEFQENSGMKATYVSGGGTKNWVFHAVVKDGTEYETAAMEISRVVYQGKDLTTVLTDYVGNPLEKASETFSDTDSETPSIAWAGLNVDNTPPEITIERDGRKQFKISVVDKGTYPSGVFSKPDTNTGAPGSSSQAALVYYTWVKKEDQAAVLDTLRKNNFAAIKRYSLTAEAPEGIRLGAANVGGKSALIKLDDSAEDAEWVLLAFAADKSWDGARQIIQYNKYKSYKNTESGAKEYYEAFMEAYGGSSAASDAVQYTALTSKPDNWDTNYFSYFTKNGSSYESIPQADSYPEFVSGRVYQPGYTVLSSDPTAGKEDQTWDDVYTDYYVKNGDSYVHPESLTAYPAFAENTYYVQYALLSSESEPGDWACGEYYEMLSSSDGTLSYQKVAQNGTPEFAAGTIYSAAFTALPKTKKVSVQLKNTDGTPKVDSKGDPVYGYVSDSDIASQAASDSEGNYIYQPGSDGGRVYQYYNADGSVYSGSDTTLQSEVTNEILKTKQYYVPQEGSAKNYDLASTVAQANGRDYYTVAATKVDAQPSDWDTNYGNYYRKIDVTYGAVTVTTGEGGAVQVPAWEADKYYSEKEEAGSTEADESVTTYTLLTAKPADWDQQGTNDEVKYYYAMLPESFMTVEKETVPYQPGAFYKKAASSSGYDLLTEQPDDWADAYSTRYYVKNGSSYTLIPENVAKFEAGKYYKAGYTPVASQPANWNTVFATGGYSWYIGPASTAERDRTDSQFVALSQVPKRMLGLYNVKTGGVATSESDSTMRLVSAPTFTSGTYYKMAMSVTALFDAFKDPTRREEFISAIMKAATNVDKMRVISAYSEFAAKLVQVDQKLMQESGKYENWAVSDFQKNDSNWIYIVSSETVESRKPVITAESVEGDGTSNVTVRVKITEDNSLSSGTKYKFVPEGTEVSDTDDTLWKAVPSMSEASVDGQKEYTVALTTGEFNASLTDGSYDLYVRATDSSENTATANVATVSIDTSAEIHYALLLTEDGAGRVIAGSDGTEEENMTSSARRSVDLSVKFAGKIDGGDLFSAEKDFRLDWAFDTSAAEPSAGWTELTGGTEVSGDEQLGSRTTKLYPIGDLGAGKATGTWYLHLRYRYTRNGQTVSQSVNKAFSINTTAPVVTLNTLSSTDAEAVVQATVTSVSGAASTQYVWIAGKYDQTQSADVASAVSGAAWQDISLPAQLSVRSTDAVTQEQKGNVTLIIRATDSLGNEALSFQSYVVAGAAGSVAPPNPATSLLDVQKAGDGYYAVVKLDMPGGALPDSDSAYSTAIVKGGGEPVWSRWTPYESMIRVKISSSEADLSVSQLWFKFVSSTGTVTDSADYQKVTGLAYPFTSTQPWAAVSRSTFQPVSMDTGVKLRFSVKTGALVTAASSLPESALTSEVSTSASEGCVTTVRESGLFVYNVTEGETTLPLYVSISNIPAKTEPSWKMSFSRLDMGSQPVIATLTIGGDVSVDEVTFQADPVTVIENGVETKQTPEPVTAANRPSYTFYRNGTAYFQLSNVSGGRTTAKAVVNWIDAEAAAAVITPDYGPYQTVEDSAGKVVLASGVALQFRTEEPVNVYQTSARYDSAGDQYLFGQAFSFTAPQNKVFQFFYRDQYDNNAAATYQVGNLVQSLPTPEVEVSEPDSQSRVTVTVRGRVPDLAVGVAGYELYAGITTAGAKIPIASDGSYEYVETVTANGAMTGYVCDNLNNIASYSYAVDSIDTQPPMVEVKDTAWVTQGDDPGEIDWWDYVTASDNVTPTEDLTLTAQMDGGTVNTSVAGSYRVRITVTDAGGNEGRADVFLYVVPADGMLVTDQNGVLFYSKSSDVALVDNDHIQMTVSRYQMMRYGDSQEAVTNGDMTFDIFIQKSLYREGQLKYIQTVSFRDQGGDSSQTVDIQPQDLDGPGYYTLIVRNSEREREFTSFFVSASLLS